jgi:hypothetical protein
VDARCCCCFPSAAKSGGPGLCQGTVRGGQRAPTTPGPSWETMPLAYVPKDVRRVTRRQNRRSGCQQQAEMRARRESERVRGGFSHWGQGCLRVWKAEGMETVVSIPQPPPPAQHQGQVNSPSAPPPLAVAPPQPLPRLPSAAGPPSFQPSPAHSPACRAPPPQCASHTCGRW